MAQAIQFAILGLGAGAAYTLLAQGIVLIYRGSGIVNFAHGAIAMFACVLLLLDAGREARLGGRSSRSRSRCCSPRCSASRSRTASCASCATTAPLVRLVATLGVLIVLQGLAGQKLWDSDFHQIDQFLPDPQLHVARVVRLRRRARTRRRPAGPPDPARDRDRAHVRAVGLHPVHEDRARDLGERGERAGGGGARMVAEPPRHGHVGDRRRHRRVRRHPARTERRAQPDGVHDRRHGRRRSRSR